MINDNSHFFQYKGNSSIAQTPLMFMINGNYVAFYITVFIRGHNSNIVIVAAPCHLSALQE